MLTDWEHLPTEVPHDFKIVPKGFIDASEYSMDTENTPAGKLGDWSVAFRNPKGELCVMPFTGANPHMMFGGTCVMHQAKWDIRVLQAAGMTPPTNVHDTMIAAYCLGLGKQAPKDSTKSQSGSEMVGGLGLKYLARRHLGMQMKTWSEVYNRPELVPEYNANDSVATYLLWEKWKPQLPQHYWDIDMPLLPVLMAIEDRGIQVDPSFLKEYAARLDEELAKFDLPFNPFATQEVQSYVYGTLGIEPWRFTDTGAPSTDADVLETIDDLVVKDLLRYKGLYQERNTYAKGYMKGLDYQGRLHTELKQTSTATGRLSSANPNLQNVIKEGSDLRKLFIAPEGMKLIRLDYDQLEWRVLAAITQDPILLKALASGKKIHQVTAEQMNIPYDKAKKGNFAIQYGAKAWTLAQNLECTIEEAKQFMVLYFKKFPGVKKYQDQQREIASSEKKVTNYFGRVRRLDAMFAQDWRIRQEGEKEAINTPIQGAAGEVVKLAMIELHKHNANMLLQVHDELLFEVPEKEAKDYAQWLQEYVPTITSINGVSFPVEVCVGDTWHECCK